MAKKYSMLTREEFISYHDAPLYNEAKLVVSVAARTGF